MSTSAAAASAAPQPQPQYMSTTKHNRIDVWRTEVAAAHDALTSSPSANSAASSPSIASSSSTASSSSALSHLRLRSHTRRPSILRRLARRLSGRSVETGAKPEDEWDQDMRTDMYKETGASRTARATVAAAKNQHGNNAMAAEEDIISLGREQDDDDDASGDNGRRGLMTSKERLERAAKLMERNG